MAPELWESGRVIVSDEPGLTIEAGWMGVQLLAEHGEATREGDLTTDE